MPLYLVGENINKVSSHHLAEKGQIIQLMRGIYVDANDDADTLALTHAIRIARYLYPQAYLSAASALLLGPTADGRLYLSGRRSQRTRIRSLEIIQNPAPRNPSLGEAIVDDGMGEFRVKASSVRQRVLEAFRLRSEHAASIDADMRQQLKQRLLEEYKTPKQAADALWVLARENEWIKEAQQAERFLAQSAVQGAVQKFGRNQAAIDLVVAWHGQPLGHLVHDGFEWRWKPGKVKTPMLIRQTVPGALPPFVISLLPEGWLVRVLRDDDQRSLLRSGQRYLSNIAIVENGTALENIPPDVLVATLREHSQDGIFTGQYKGPARQTLERSFEENLAALYARADTPRLSGIQIKAPMFLDTNGDLLPSTGRPFTHILKPAGTNGFEALPVIEWLCLALGRAAGFDVPAFALIGMPDRMHPALLVERFDIRTSQTDERRFAMEDLCSVLDLPPEAKYSGTMERVGQAVRGLSTAADADLLVLLKRAVFAWLIADGDMHLKNMALLKIAGPGHDRFASVRLAPLYDAVTTRVFPNLQHDRMALKVNGKDSRLRRDDFRKLGQTIGLRAADVEAAIDEVANSLKQALPKLALPELIHVGDEGRSVVKRMIETAKAQLEGFF